MEQTKASSLIDMANGAIKERLDYEMGRVIQNISDPNTKATAQRTITVTITLEPDEERQHVEVSATAGCITVRGTGALQAEVYTADGRLIATASGQGTLRIGTAGYRGVALVRTGSQVTKVAIR